MVGSSLITKRVLFSWIRTLIREVKFIRQTPLGERPISIVFQRIRATEVRHYAVVLIFQHEFLIAPVRSGIVILDSRSNRLLRENCVASGINPSGSSADSCFGDLVSVSICN